MFIALRTPGRRLRMLVTRSICRITSTRNRRINHYLHAASKRVVDYLAKEGVGTIILAFSRPLVRFYHVQTTDCRPGARMIRYKVIPRIVIQ